MKCTKNTHQRTSHTPGLWRFDMDCFVSHIVAPDPTGENPCGSYITEIANGEDVGRFATYEQHEANARRICAAVNACQGISTEALEGNAVSNVLKTLRLISSYPANGNSDPDVMASALDAIVTLAERAIAQAGGQHDQRSDKTRPVSSLAAGAPDCRQDRCSSCCGRQGGRRHVHAGHRIQQKARRSIPCH